MTAVNTASASPVGALFNALSVSSMRSVLASWLTIAVGACAAAGIVVGSTSLGSAGSVITTRLQPDATVPGRVIGPVSHTSRVSAAVSVVKSTSGLLLATG